jgi:AcrR family transcriptional regulator
MDPEIRRQQFIKAAEVLFREKGYDNVTMSEIADKVGMSHGAYFYYFKSKEELMRALIVNSVRENEAYLKAVVSEKSKSAVEKMQSLLSLTIGAYSSEQDFIEFAHDYGNAGIYREYTLMTRKANVPLLAEIIKQGNREGTFDVKYPEDTIEYMMFIFENLYDTIAGARDKKVLIRKMKALEIAVSRLLGAKEGTFCLTGQ